MEKVIELLALSSTSVVGRGEERCLMVSSGEHDMLSQWLNLKGGLECLEAELKTAVGK